MSMDVINMSYFVLELAKKVEQELFVNLNIKSHSMKLNIVPSVVKN